MAQGHKRKHITLTLCTKVEILQKIDNGEKLSNLADFYGIGRATIHDIKKNREKILSYVNSSDCLPGRQTMKSGEYPQVENALYKWFLEERSRKNTITGDIIREKAKCLYNTIMHKDDFKASDGWLDKFKKRFGIRLFNNVETNRCQEYPSALQATFLQKVQELNLLPDQIYTTSDSVLFWKLLPHKKYRNMQGDPITFMTCANSTGTHKLKLLIIGKNKECSLQNFTTSSVIYKTQTQAYLTQELLNEWFHEQFVPSVSEFLVQQNLPHRALLVLSNSQSCPNEAVVKSHDGAIQIMYLQHYALSLPTNEIVNHAIKCYYKKDLIYKAVNENEGFDIFLSKYKLEHAVLSLSYVWEKISSNVIILSWKKLWPEHPFLENVTHGRQHHENDDLIINNEFVERVYSKCTKNEALIKDDMKDWLSQTYDENILMTLNEQLINDIKTEDTDIKDVPYGWTFDPVHVINNDEALHAINTCITWGEENDIERDDIIVLSRIREKIHAKVVNVKTEETSLEDDTL